MFQHAQEPPGTSFETRFSEALLRMRAEDIRHGTNALQASFAGLALSAR